MRGGVVKPNADVAFDIPVALNEELVREVDVAGEPEFEALEAAIDDLDDELFTIAQQMPVPPGGDYAFRKKLHDDLHFPVEAMEQGITGKVFVQFTVDKQGRIVKPQVVRGLGAGCDEAALAAIQKQGKWTAGTWNGKPIKTKMVVPVQFSKDKIPPSGLLSLLN